MEKESKETILQLLKVRQSYQQKLRDIECLLLDAAAAENEDNEEAEEDIKRKIETLQNELQANGTCFALKERMLKYLQFSNTLRNVTVDVPDDEDVPKKETEESLLKKLSLLDELSQKLMTSTDEIEELNARLDAKRKKSLSLIIKARCLTSELKSLEERLRERENQQKSETIFKLRMRLERGIHINSIIRKVFLDLVHSTEIDWYEDETLRKTVLLLGDDMKTHCTKSIHI